jgi:hypothetical protein
MTSQLCYALGYAQGYHNAPGYHDASGTPMTPPITVFPTNSRTADSLLQCLQIPRRIAGTAADSTRWTLAVVLWTEPTQDKIYRGGWGCQAGASEQGKVQGWGDKETQLGGCSQRVHSRMDFNETVFSHFTQDITYDITYGITAYDIIVGVVISLILCDIMFYHVISWLILWYHIWCDIILKYDITS